MEADAGYRRLRIVSYNIQVGIETQGYDQYVTNSWKHVLPWRERTANLDRIAELVQEYDIVGLQEVDAGSLRSQFVDQIEYLAQRGGFMFWHKQVNRNLGRFAQHSNGLLSRLRPTRVEEHSLPGLVPGRGAIIARFGAAPHELVIGIMHLALRSRARMAQVAYLCEYLADEPFVILMGDLNCTCDSPEIRHLTQRLGLMPTDCVQGTFPSWRPRRKLDHILTSDGLIVERAEVLTQAYSDHLPIAIEVLMPDWLMSWP